MITVKFFGHLRLRIGHEEIEIELEQPAEIKTIIERITLEFPIFDEIAQSSRFVIAVDQKVVNDSHIVSPGGTVTIFPHLSGG